MTRSVPRSRCAELLRALAVAASLLPAATALAAELRVSGRVLDGTGKSAAKAAVELFEGRSSEPLARTTTGSDGRFEIVATEPGMYRVVVRAAGALPMEAKLLPLLAPAELPPLRLTADEPLRVRVFGSEGPLANVRVAARPLQRRTTSGWEATERATTSDEKGALFLPRAKGEALELTTLGSDFVDIRPARERTIDIRRDGACTRTLLVRGPDGRPVSGAAVWVEPLRVGSTNDDGLLAIGIPCHGELPAVVEASDGRSADVRLRAHADAAPLEVTLEAPARHGGRVIDGETRDPLAGAFVWFDADPAGFARTDAKGTYAAIPPNEKTPESAFGRALRIRGRSMAMTRQAASRAEANTSPSCRQNTESCGGRPAVVDLAGRGVHHSQPSVPNSVCSSFPPNPLPLFLSHPSERSRPIRVGPGVQRRAGPGVEGM